MYNVPYLTLNLLSYFIEWKRCAAEGELEEKPPGDGLAQRYVSRDFECDSEIVHWGLSKN